VLARAHAKASEISATISGYLGASSDAFDTAMGKFALAYADQAERDHAALKAAVKNGRIVTSEEF
jgi:DNA-binding IclR family transcriptional regulator